MNTSETEFVTRIEKFEQDRLFTRQSGESSAGEPEPAFLVIRLSPESLVEVQRPGIALEDLKIYPFEAPFGRPPGDRPQKRKPDTRPPRAFVDVDVFEVIAAFAAKTGKVRVKHSVPRDSILPHGHEKFDKRTLAEYGHIQPLVTDGQIIAKAHKIGEVPHHFQNAGDIDRPCISDLQVHTFKKNGRAVPNTARP
jgi:hypothetical protein